MHAHSLAIVRAVALALAACHHAHRDVTPPHNGAPGLHDTRGGLTATIDGTTLVLADAGHHGSLPLDGVPQQVAVVPLTADGSRHAAWLVTHSETPTAATDTGLLVRLGDHGAEVALRMKVGEQHQFIGGGDSDLRLLDLDGDNRYELVQWLHYGDDTGQRDIITVFADRGAGFIAAPELLARAPAEPRPTWDPSAPEMRAIATHLQVAKAYPLGSLDLDAAGALAIGPDLAMLIFVPDGPAPMVGRWSLVAVRAFTAAPTVLAVQPLGKSDLPDDVHPCSAAPSLDGMRGDRGRYFYAAWQTTPDRFSRQDLQWTGARFAALGPIEDRACPRD